MMPEHEVWCGDARPYLGKRGPMALDSMIQEISCRQSVNGDEAMDVTQSRKMPNVHPLHLKVRRLFAVTRRGARRRSEISDSRAGTNTHCTRHLDAGSMPATE